MKGAWIWSLVQWQPIPVLLPGKSQGWRSLIGCSPWGCEEPDTTEWLHSQFSLSCIAEGNGNSLQCSCLESPRDGGAWWAAVYGVTQNRTRLKWLSSSSSSSSSSRALLFRDRFKLNKEIRWTLSYLDKIYPGLKVIIMPTGATVEAFPLKSGTKKDVCLSPRLFNRQYG